jgi:hypothetical protein
MNYSSIEEQETPSIQTEKDSYVVQTTSDKPLLSTTPSTFKGIDSLTKMDTTKVRIPTNPHLPKITIKPYTEE